MACGTACARWHRRRPAECRGTRPASAAEARAPANPHSLRVDHAQLHTSAWACAHQIGQVVERHAVALEDRLIALDSDWIWQLSDDLFKYTLRVAGTPQHPAELGV